MKWYLNRTGEPEGPFDESQLVEMIRSGQVADGNVAEDGSSAWVPLTQHPVFADALADWVAEPVGPQAPPPTELPPGASPAATVPQSPLGAHPGGHTAAKPSGMGPIIALLVAAIVLIGGGVAAYMLFFRATSPQLAKHVPKDTQIYIEAPSLSGAVVAFASMDIVDDKKLNPEKSLKELQKALAHSFDLKKEHAQNLVESMESVAVAGRSVMKKPKFAIIIQFSDSEGVEKLLDSERFTKEDKLSEGTYRYVVDPADIDFKDQQDLPFWEKAFARFEVEEDDRDTLLVWLSEEQLLVFGQDDFVSEIVDVVQKDGDSLLDNEHFAEVSFEPNSALLSYGDPTLFGDVRGEDAKDIVKGYFDGVKPVAVSMGFDDEGIRMTYTGELKGKCLPEDGLADTADLDLYKRLPDDTIAYLAVSTETELEGKSLLKHARKQVRCVNRRAEEELEDKLDEIEETYDFKLGRVLDSVGDQAVVALVLDKEFEIDPEQSAAEQNDHRAGLLAIHVGDKSAAEKAVKILREEGFEDHEQNRERYEVSKKGAGFKAEPTEDDDGTPDVEARFFDEGQFLVIAVGGNKVVRRIIEAFKDGTNTLEDHVPHGKVLNAISGSPRAIAWVDSGRGWSILKDYARDEMPDEYEDFTDALKEAGLSVGMFHLKGDDRMNSMMALELEPTDEAFDVEVRSINEHAGSGLLALLSNFSLGKTETRITQPTEVINSGDDGVIPACEDYFTHVETKCPPSVRSAMENSIKSMRTQIRGLPDSTRTAMAASCQRLLTTIRRTCP